MADVHEEEVEQEHDECAGRDAEQERHEDEDGHVKVPPTTSNVPDGTRPADRFEGATRTKALADPLPGGMALALVKKMRATTLRMRMKSTHSLTMTVLAG